MWWFPLPLGFVITGPMLLAIMALSTAASVGATMYSSRQTAKTQEKIGAANKQRSDRDAAQLRKEREAEELAERREARRRRARIESRYAAGGVLLQGSAEDALVEQAAVDELNILNRSRLAENKAKSIEDAGRMGLWEASLSAQSTRTQGVASSVSQIAGSAGSFALSQSE